MSPSELQPHELMQQMAAFFESHEIDYRVVGSMASMTYGEPRLTIDIDIVADLKPEHANLICESFPAPEYYVSKPAIRDAIARCFQFKILHNDSGLKVDVFVPESSPFSQSAAARVRRIKSEGLYDAWFRLSRGYRSQQVQVLSNQWRNQREALARHR